MSSLREQGRVRRIPLTWQTLGMILSGRWDSLKSNAPADLEIYAIETTHRNYPRCCEVYVTSSTFSPVEDGAKIPEVLFAYHGQGDPRLTSTPKRKGH